MVLTVMVTSEGAVDVSQLLCSHRVWRVHVCEETIIGSPAMRSSNLATPTNTLIATHFFKYTTRIL